MTGGNGIIRPGALAPGGVDAGFTTRLADGPGLDASVPVFGLTQVHSARVVVLGDEDVPEATARIEADALVTTRRGACLTVRVADCVPVIIVAPSGVASVHAGWRGLASGILGEAVGRLCGLTGCLPSELRAAAGPAIGPCCYEVDIEVGQRIAAPSGAGVLGGTYGQGKVKADVWQAAINQLRDAGLPERGIEALRICTRCHPWLLHSFRRDGPGAGRQLGFVAMLG